MPTACDEVLEEKRKAFEEAKKGVDPEKIDRIMRGLPIEEKLTQAESDLKHAWVAFHQCM